MALLLRSLIFLLILYPIVLISTFVYELFLKEKSIKPSLSEARDTVVNATKIYGILVFAFILYVLFKYQN